MPRPTCLPCCNPLEASRHVDSYRAAVLLILCEIAGAGSGALFDGEVAVTPVDGVIATAASGQTLLAPAVAGKRIRVLQYNLSSAGAVNVKFQSAGTDKTGLIYLTTGSNVSAPYSPSGIFTGGVNEPLNINLSAAVGVGGTFKYVLVN